MWDGGSDTPAQWACLYSGLHALDSPGIDLQQPINQVRSLLGASVFSLLDVKIGQI